MNTRRLIALVAAASALLPAVPLTAASSERGHDSTAARAYAALDDLGVPEAEAGNVAVVDIRHQVLVVLAGRQAVGMWPVATGRGGVNARAGSGGTPPGVHRVGAVVVGRTGEVFKSRRTTGRTVAITSNSHGRAYITTALLTLEGQEPRNSSSRRRGIYIHGTNLEGSIGRPLSSGCIRMRNTDVLALAALMPAGSWVVILE